MVEIRRRTGFGRVALVGLVVALYLAGTVPAMAGGVSSATIEGPGLKQPVVVEVDAYLLEKASGYWQIVYGEDPPGLGPTGTILPQRPAGDLGLAYQVTFYYGDSFSPPSVTVYPFALGGPLVDFGEIVIVRYEGFEAVRDSWFAADPMLADLMIGYGVPVTLDTSSDRQALSAASSSRVSEMSVVGLGILVVGGVWALRRRPRRVGAP